MQIRQRLSEDDAVSPVIGVILMVAITVILAAVIASFVLGMGPNTSTTPTATFSSDYDSGTGLTITMDSGEKVDASKITFTSRDNFDGSSGDISDSSKTWADAKSVSKLTAGKSIVIQIDGSDGYEVKMIYTDGDTTSTMQTFEG